MAGDRKMSKKSKKAKEAEARTEVNGEPTFKNGKLVTPEPKTATDKLMEMQKKKEQLKSQEPKTESKPEPATLKEAQQLIEMLRAKLKSSRAPKLEELPDIESPIQYLNFCQVQKARDEMLHILEEIESLEYVEIRHNKYGETYRVAGQTVAELWPLKRGWSACIKPHSVKRWDMEEFLTAFKERVEEIKAECEKEQKDMPKPAKATKKVESVQDIKQRIEKLSEGHNAIHIKNITAEIKQYADVEGYHFVDDGHAMVVREL